MRKLRISWQLARQCWKVLLLDRELLLFPVMSSAALLLVIASFLTPLWSTGVLQRAAEHKDIAHDPLLVASYVAFYLVSYFVMLFFNTALVACALIRLRGGNPTVADGLRAASARLPAILGWSTLSALVGLFVRALEERVGIIGKIIVGFIGIAWAIASFFVIPTIVAENVGPVEALKRSASLIKRTWGETLTVQVGLSLVLAAVGIVAAVFFAGGSALIGSHLALGGTLIGIGILWMLGVLVIGATLQAILTAALYLYAADGKVPGGFDDELLQSAFARK
jgi:hypothetical protein